MSLFDPALPVAASGKPPPQGGDKKPEGDKKKPDDKKGEGPVKTQMIPENPADGLGYDPKIIPTEKI